MSSQLSVKLRNQDYIEVKSWFYQKNDYSEAQEDYEGNVGCSA